MLHMRWAEHRTRGAVYRGLIVEGLSRVVEKTSPFYVRSRPSAKLATNE